MYYIGMDLHKMTTTFCAKTKDGKLIDSSKVITNPFEISKYLRRFLDEKISLVLEPVSQWYFYADLIQRLGVELHLANPLRVKAIAEARIKTDKIDASVLCDLLRANLLPEAYFSPVKVRSFKEMTRYRASLINLRTQVKNKIHAIVSKNGLLFQATRLFGKAGRNWLKSLRLPFYFQSSLDRYLGLVEYLDHLVENADQEIEQTVTDDPQAKLLTTIPGISYVSALTIVSEIGEIERFPSAKKLMGYAGLVPSTYSSGETTRHGHITKQGSRWLRWTMVEVAHRQILCKKKIGFAWYYLKMRQRKGSGTAAVATARKMLAVIFRLLKDKRPFEERIIGSPGYLPNKYRLKEV